MCLRMLVSVAFLAYPPLNKSALRVPSLRRYLLLSLVYLTEHHTMTTYVCTNTANKKELLDLEIRHMDPQ